MFEFAKMKVPGKTCHKSDIPNGGRIKQGSASGCYALTELT